MSGQFRRKSSRGSPHYGETYRSKNGKRKRKSYRLDCSCVHGTNPI
ncbi:hypothetical protein LINPERHAP2_LOCUS43081 [Linum perenne]